MTGDQLNPAAERLLVVALHGYGGTGAELVQMLSAADTADSAVVLGPDGPCEPALFRAGRAWFPVTSQLSVIAQRAHELAPPVSQYVAEVQKRYGITADRTCLVGFSQGASVAAAVLAHAQNCRRAVLVCGRVPRDGPAPPAVSSQVEILAVTGGRDRFVNHDDVRSDLELGRFRTSFRQVALPGLGHEFTHDVARLALAHAASQLQWSEH